MAMPRNVRALWIVVGTVLTVLTVVLTAFGVWSAIRTPRHYDYVYPGSYGAALIDEQTREVTTTVYRITTPVVIVDATGPVTIRVEHGEPDRLTIRREVSWGRYGRRFDQEWEDGKVLSVKLSCANPRSGRDRGCSADYRLTVPPDVKVLIAGPESSRECPVTTPETVCRPVR